MRFETVNLGIPGPQGVTGAPGPQGEQGPQGPQGPVGTVLSGGVYHVGDIDAAKAIEGLTPGSFVFVGDDPFIVIDDDTLGTDGGTVFIPTSELSAYYEEAIPPATFAGANGALVAMEYDLDHTGIDFESVELVLTDGGETISIWGLHGHVFQPLTTERQFTPQLPLIDTARGKFRDPYAGFTGTKGASHPALRTGGALLRYKYATSGLRLKRVTGPIFDLRWWPVVAVDDEEVGVQTDNSGKICWAVNAAAAAGAEAVYIHKFYHYARCVEWPEGVELLGRGPGLSGFRCMDNAQHTQLLLTTSSDGAAADPTVNPLLKPATRLWSYDSVFLSNSTAFYPASGARRIRISGIEFDGNLANNMRFFSERNNEYAYTYSNQIISLFNATTSAAFSVTNQANRVIPENMIVELHNVSMHGYAHCLLGHHFCTFVSTGLLELGETIAGHWMYLTDGVYENVRCTGFAIADGLRVRKFVAKSVEFVLYAPPAAYFDQPLTLGYDALVTPFTVGQTLTGVTSGATGLIDDVRTLTGTTGNIDLINIVGTFQNNEVITDGLGGHADANGVPALGGYFLRGMQLVSLNEYMPQQQLAVNAFNYPELPPYRVVIDNVFIDAMRLDEAPAGKGYMYAIPFLVNGDHFQIKSGKMRFGQLTPAATIIVNTQGNVSGGQPYRNQVYENISIEYSSRKGIQLLATGSTDGGYAGVKFRNITFEARASTHVPGNPAPSGVTYLLGLWRFHEDAPVEPTPPTYLVAYDGRDVEFSAVTVDATLNGKYIDLTPPDPLAPTYRYWFNYNALGSAPAAGGNTLVTVPVAAGATTAALAQAFSLAVAGTIASPAVSAPYLTAATFGTKSVVGAYSHYRSDTKGGYVAISISAAAGVTTALRPYHRNFEPSLIEFEKFIANDPTYISLINITEVGPHRDLYFSFKDCVLGAFQVSLPLLNAGGSFLAGAVTAIKDQVHWAYENTIFDLRDGYTSWSNLDLFLYAGKFRNCRVRTLSSATGLSLLGAGYETLLSEQSGVYTVTPGADASSTTTWIDIQTKLFWQPKPGGIRLYPADAATAVVWNTNMPSVEWRKSARPVSLTSAALLDDEYYQGSATPSAINEDRRAPVLRLNFASALAASPLKIGWTAAVSP
jgi:hypothetical protein